MIDALRGSSAGNHLVAPAWREVLQCLSGNIRLPTLI
jgi:hypothetical protein